MDKSIVVAVERREKHPLYKKFVNILECNNTKQLTICNQKIIVEAEMLFEKKFLIGPLTSLEKYAKLFGSNFKRIEIY